MRPQPSVSGDDTTKHLTLSIASFTLNNKIKILIFCFILTVLSILGVSRLQVENRFIDYFKTSTEIYHGMSLIDKKLGGTTPLDIIVDPDQDFYVYLEELKQEKESGAGDPFDDPFGGNAEEEEEENYWFHADMLTDVEKIHDYLEALPEIGKALSIATTMKVVKQLNNEQMPGDYDLALFRKLVSGHVKETFINPYLSADANQIRITMRIEEADPTLNRGELIDKIKKFLVEEMGISADRIKFTGRAVLYNNMLHSLYRSQILTLGMVFLANSSEVHDFIQKRISCMHGHRPKYSFGRV